MARAAVVENGVVVNVIVASEQYAAEKGFIVSDSAQMGYLYDEETGEFTPPPPPERSKQELGDILNRIHDQYTDNHTEHRGIMIAIDLEARLNSWKILERVKEGKKQTPFRWFSGDQYFMINNIEEMQAVHDVVWSAYEHSFEVKSIVLDRIEETEDTRYFDVRAEWDAAMQQ